jgi:hypothetical protein
MTDPVRRYLDGEVELESVPPSQRAEAVAWGRLLDAFRRELPGGSAPPWLEQRVMAEIRVLPAPGRLRRAMEWVLQPRPLRISPLMAGAAVAVVLALLLAPPFGGGGPGMPSVREAVVLVQFSLEAPGARSVAVGGDFDAWAGSHALSDADGDGVWTGRIPVSPGVHSYMFLIDGSDWVTDPGAERYADDGFGNRNAVLAIATPAT